MPPGRPPRDPASTSCASGQPPSLGGGGDPLRRGHRRAGRRIGLGVVVQLDDLDRVEERRGQLGAAHHQHRRDREVRHHGAVQGASSPRNSWANVSGPRPSGRSCPPRCGFRAWPATARCAVLRRRPRSRRPPRRIHERLRLAGNRHPLDHLPSGVWIDGGDQSSSGSSATAAHTADPIRPPAPLTPTRMWGEYGLGRRERADQHGHRSTGPVHPVETRRTSAWLTFSQRSSCSSTGITRPMVASMPPRRDMRAPVSSSPIS